MPKNLQRLLILLIVVALGGAGYWYFFGRAPSAPAPVDDGSGTQGTGFTPYGRNPTTGTTGQPVNTKPVQTSTSTQVRAAPIPLLRLLSDSPIGGYGAYDTATTTIARWIDRGRGNIYEAGEDSLDIKTISNTLLPRAYSSVWNKDLTSFIASVFPDGSSVPATIYANLLKQSPVVGTSSSVAPSSLTPYALRGGKLPDGVTGYAISPKKDKVFFLISENNGSGGYIAAINGTSMTKIFSSPLSQLNVDWPADNTIAITTKGAGDASGYLYLVDPKTGVWKKAIGPLPGLSAKVSHDSKYAMISVAGASNNIITAIYNLQKGTNTDAVIRTLADKCAWGNFYKGLIYCSVPFQEVSGTYPDDWYRGTTSSVDKIWQINADTGELHLVSSLVDQADRPIDGFNLGLDPKDNYLFFMNKNDLSFWSLDLVKGQ